MHLINCAKLCAALYYPEGFPIEGAPDKCLCADVVEKKTQPPLPITLHLPKDYKPEPERQDDRPKQEYDDE